MKKVLQLALLILACIPSSSHTMFTHCFPKKIRPSQTIKTPGDIMSELEKIKQQLLDQEHQALWELAKPHMTYTQFQEILLFIKKEKQLNHRKRCSPSSYAIHDSNVPEHLRTMIQNDLMNDNIEPLSVSILYDEKIEHLADRINFAKAITFQAHENNPSSKIQIGSSLLSCPPDIIQHVIAHEVQHVVLQHSLTQGSICYFLTINNPLIVIEAENKKLVSIHEEQANIFAALKNKNNAQRAQKFYCEFNLHHPNILDHTKHCKTLTYVHDLWKLKEQLEKSSHRGATS